ncbi:MAG: FAD-binding oxidoreductase [Acidimicrobiia bacterium]|nr:FAD-binding oxidoreductase [Acidimicrobiia bacterium]
MVTPPNAIVIGAGVIGCSVALELSRRNHPVTVVDSLPAAGYGSTSSSSGIIRFHYSTEAGVAMAWEGRHYWRNWAAHVRAEPGPDGSPPIEHEAVAAMVEVPMYMFLGPDAERPIFLDHFDKIGIPYEVQPRSALESGAVNLDLRMFGPPARLEDDGNPFWGEPEDRFEDLLWMGGAGYVPDPQLAAQNLCTAAMAEGVEFLFNTKVVAVNRSADGDRVSGVTVVGGTAGGSGDGRMISAPIVVNVAGPHSSIVNELAGVTGDMVRSGRALRREVYIAPAPAGFDERSGFQAADLDVGVYFRPESGGNIMVGSVEPECDELVWVDPDDFDETVTEDEFQLAMMRTARRLPELGIPRSKRGLVALYDATEDWTPIYDRSSLDGFYMACGSSGNQFKNAAVAGHLMAELIDAVESGHDQDGDPIKVTGVHTGLEIDTATFSRRREVDVNAANTVLG